MQPSQNIGNGDFSGNDITDARCRANLAIALRQWEEDHATSV